MTKPRDITFFQTLYKCYAQPLTKKYNRTLCTIAGATDSETTDYSVAKPFSEIPGPKGLPYFGTLFQYRLGRYRNIDRLQDALMEQHRTYGKIMKETLLGETSIHLFDPDYIKLVYQNEGKNPYLKPLLETAQIYRKMRHMSPGLGNMNGEEWYRLRSAVQKMMLRPKEVTVYLPLVLEVADDFLARIKSLRDENGEVKEFANEAAKWSLESSAMTCFEKRLGYLHGREDNSDEGQKMVDSNTTLFCQSAKLKYSLPLYRIFPTPKWKKLTEAEDYFFGRGQRLISECVSEIKTLSDKGQLEDGQYKFMSYLMSRPELDLKDVSIICLSLFADGLRTTVPALLFNLYTLATNPEVQEKVLEEIRTVLPVDGVMITPEIINQMTYLKACVKETFRLFPVGLDVSRILQKNIVIGGYQLPTGTQVVLNNFVLFKNPKHFVDPEDFHPERWLRDGSACNVHPYILTPFGHGVRMCAGRRFAEQELYVLLTKILLKYQIQWHHGKMGQKYEILMVPDCPAQFSFVKR
ncbi:probable cytochrome P450 CYP44 [Gigantopelta aegis]|uniref:probable cytochrome P450 CYP44 n=1 Tax=Gigantopelta aegis TaxID=1735272 RepID=UPI001B88D365|nr:probable cytochrome P450 CYP44 [Gigantopelta aegis]